MEIAINTHQMELTTRLQNYVEKKVGRLDRYMPNMVEIRVDLSAQKARNVQERQIAQVTVRDSKGMILRAEEHSNDMFAAIDAATDKMYRQIKKYRGKRRRRRGAGLPEEMLNWEPLPIDDAEEDEPEAKIVRRKQFSLQPMSTDEAIDQLELLGHDFFVFFNMEAEAVNVLYRRRQGDYGLLQPEID